MIRTLTFVVAMLLCTLGLRAQVTGHVYDKLEGEPVVGATVRVDGSKAVAVTDIDGKFSLPAANAGKAITVTYVGYQPQTVTLKEGMVIYLESTAEALDEVIVVAFGRQKREAFTGSASVVTAEEISKSQVNSPIEALNGRVTGMQMTETNSFADDPSVTIRGIGSINAGTEPLYVVDGLPYNGYLTDLNPADIENITVLKDAASNALYGARGANGVIMVTTKQAARGNTSVTIDAKWGANTNGRNDYDVITNPGEYYEARYVALRNYYMVNQGQTAEAAHVSANNALVGPLSGGSLGYNVYNVPQGQYLIGTNGRLNPEAQLGNRVAYDNKIYTIKPDDWSKHGMRDGFRQEYNINISGGNQQFTFMATMGYLHNEGLAYNNEFDRVTARLKTTYQAYSWLKVGANAGYTYSDMDVMGQTYGLKYNMAPIYPLFIRDGQGNIMTDRNGPMYDYGMGDNAGLIRPADPSGNVVQSDLIDKSVSTSNAMNMQGYADFTFLNGFKFTANASVYVTEVRMLSGVSPDYGYAKDYGGVNWVGHYRTMDTNYQQLLSYTKQAGRNHIDVLLGHEYSRNTNTELDGTKYVVADYAHNQELAGAIVNADMNSSSVLYNVEGWFGRANYDYDNRYFASLSFRRDGSSVFHPKHRWGNFWSLGGAWILTKEHWMPKSSVLNTLKLKMSYGEQGNDGIGNFLYSNTYNISNANDEVAYVFARKGNEHITWEKAGSFNTGVEFSLWNGRLDGELVYYNRNTFDMLMSITTPASLGYTSYYDNVGNMANTGLEFDFNAVPVRTKHFSWSIGANLTWQRNRITKLPKERKGYEMDGHLGYFSDTFYYGEGLPILTWYTRRYAGVNETGQSLFYYIEDDGTETTTTDYSKASYYLCGNALPDIFGGFNTSLTIYDFDISANFNYSVGGLKMNVGYKALMTSPDFGSGGAGVHRDVFKGWTPENPASDIPAYQISSQNSASTSDRFLTDASYLTFKNLTVGYRLPKHLTGKAGMKSVRIFASCENLCYWTKQSGFDPRMGESEGAGLNTAPPMRTITGGLQIQF